MRIRLWFFAALFVMATATPTFLQLKAAMLPYLPEIIHRVHHWTFPNLLTILLLLPIELFIFIYFYWDSSPSPLSHCQQYPDKRLCSIIHSALQSNLLENENIQITATGEYQIKGNMDKFYILITKAFKCTDANVFMTRPRDPYEQILSKDGKYTDFINAMTAVRSARYVGWGQRRKLVFLTQADFPSFIEHFAWDVAFYEGKHMYGYIRWHYGFRRFDFWPFYFLWNNLPRKRVRCRWHRSQEPQEEYLLMVNEVGLVRGEENDEVISIDFKTASTRFSFQDAFDDASTTKNFFNTHIIPDEDFQMLYREFLLLREREDNKDISFDAAVACRKAYQSQPDWNDKLAEFEVSDVWKKKRARLGKITARW